MKWQTQKKAKKNKEKVFFFSLFLLLSLSLLAKVALFLIFPSKIALKSTRQRGTFPAIFALLFPIKILKTHKTVNQTHKSHLIFI